jgi:hypothetical protein
MNEQRQEPIFHPDALAGSPGSQSSGAPASTWPPAYGDWREQRRAERWARREARWYGRAGRPYGWIGGAILILLGVVFLLDPNVGLFWPLLLIAGGLVLLVVALLPG